jgi:hypothetical protein
MEFCGFYYPKGVNIFSIFMFVVVGFHQRGIRTKSAKKYRIERMEAEILKLKEGMQKMATESQIHVSFCELRELISQTHFSTQKDNNEKGSTSHSLGENSDNSRGPEV